MNKNKQIKYTPEQAKEILIYGFESDGNHIIPPHYQPKKFKGNQIIWLLPANDENQLSTKITGGEYRVKKNSKGLTITFEGRHTEEVFSFRPKSDFFGKKFSFNMEGGDEFEKAYARFYWDNLLNQIAERTYMRKKKDIREGYVLSTLNKKAYAGTYPAVDHEFHMKGRFAVGGEAEASLIKRMLLLQLKIMKEDKKGLSRNVCSIQPSRRREYNVWRDSRDHKCRAQMFRITANIEFVEGLYNYYSLTKDLEFLKNHIDATEKSCDYIESFIDKKGLLDSHVYYEDQVMKDGAVLQSQLFAVNSLRLMAQMEKLLGRDEKSEHYVTLSKRLGTAAVKTFPEGFWDKENKRFIDWIDSKGKSHDHIHLLSNELPEMLGICSEEQADLCRKAIGEHLDVFSKFPSFVAAKIEDYTESEIGTGGPYDLCAAGRYWCWDAEYLASRKNGKAIKKQLEQVTAQAESDNYLMGERYDMNYVYYNSDADGKRNWHGASLYYEYPNVFLYVLICKYFGVTRGFDCDINLNPLFENGSVTLEQYGLSFTVKNSQVTSVKNIGKNEMKIKIAGRNSGIVIYPNGDIVTD